MDIILSYRGVCSQHFTSYVSHSHYQSVLWEQFSINNKINVQLLISQPFKLQDETKVRNIYTDGMHLEINNLVRMEWCYTEKSSCWNLKVTDSKKFQDHHGEIRTWRMQKQVTTYHSSLLQKSYHNNIWKAIPSSHGKHTPPDDKEIAASKINKHIKYRYLAKKAKDEVTPQHQGSSPVVVTSGIH